MSSFGIDPLAKNEVLVEQRNQMFSDAFNIPQVFGNLVNDQPTKFQQAVLYHLHITQRLASQ